MLMAAPTLIVFADDTPDRQRIMIPARIVIRNLCPVFLLIWFILLMDLHLSSVKIKKGRDFLHGLH